MYQSLEMPICAGMGPTKLFPEMSILSRFSIVIVDSGIDWLSWLSMRINELTALRFDIVDGIPPVNLLPVASKTTSFFERFPV